MPNRIIRDGFVDSEAVNALSDWTHRVYSNLLVRCDDAGRFDGRLEFIRSHLFPLGTVRRIDDFKKAVREMSGRLLVIEYEYGGKPYLQVTKWQRCGSALLSRYPWRDGKHDILYTTRATRDGDKEFVTSSLPDGMHTGSGPPADGVGGDLNTETETEAKTKTKTVAPAGVPPPKTRKGVPIPEPLWVPEFIEAWGRWEAHLQKKKVKTTDLADAEQLEKCEAWGPEFAVVCIKHSIGGNYQGLYAPKGANSQNGETPAQYARRVAGQKAG